MVILSLMQLNLNPSIKLHYEVSGQSGGPTFLLFNGASLPLDFWGPFAEKLGELGRVIRFDQRNAGKTEYSGTFTLGDIAADAIALLDEVNAEQVIAIGHAWGGRVAQVFARDYPKHLSHLVIIGTGGQFAPIDMRHIATPLLQAKKDRDREAWEPLFEAMWCGEGFSQRDGKTFQEIVSFMWNYQPPKTAVWNLDAYPSTGYWGTATVPTLLVYGSEDKNGTVDNANHLHEQLANSTLVMIDHAGHFVVREHHERVVDEIKNFIDIRPTQ